MLTFSASRTTSAALLTVAFAGLTMTTSADAQASNVGTVNTFPAGGVQGLAWGGNDAFSAGWANDEAGNDDESNFFRVMTTTGDFAGAGNSVPISNGASATSLIGEQDIDPGITSVNGGLGLQVGNVIRYSMWYQLDAVNTPTVDPAIQPVLKFEFQRLAGGFNGNPNGWDQLYDTDVDGGAGTFAPLAELSTSEWTLFSTEFEIDASITGAGLTGQDLLDATEELRAVMFVGDYNGGYTGGGSWFYDNALVEVFADANSVTPLNNPNPEGGTTFLSADFNTDGIVDLLDLDILGQNWQLAGTASTGDANGDGVVNLLDLDQLGGQWQQSSSFAEALAASGIAVPEPASIALIGLAAVGGLSRRRK